MTNNALTVPTRIRHHADLLTADFWADMGLTQLHACDSELAAGVLSPAHTAVLNITGLPVKLRSEIETYMVRCIPSASELIVPGADPLDAHWFTAWRRDPYNRAQVECRELITGTPQELAQLEQELSVLAIEHGFDVELKIVD